MEDVGLFFVHLVYFAAIWYNLRPTWYILWLFGLLFPVLAFCTKKSGNPAYVAQ
jgi:hypothetical protein